MEKTIPFDRIRGSQKLAEQPPAASAGSTPSDTEANNERFRTAIEKAVERLEEIDERDGGPMWHKAKEVLGADLFLVLHGLRGALVESV